MIDNDEMQKALSSLPEEFNIESTTGYSIIKELIADQAELDQLYKDSLQFQNTNFRPIEPVMRVEIPKNPIQEQLDNLLDAHNNQSEEQISLLKSQNQILTDSLQELKKAYAQKEIELEEAHKEARFLRRINIVLLIVSVVSLLYNIISTFI